LTETGVASTSLGITGPEAISHYQSVVERRPHNVLECGSGLSTVILGFAALLLSQEGHKCRIHAMEESVHWARDLEPLIPNQVKPFINLVVSPTVSQPEGDSWQGLRYRDKPEEPYDLVFVDGPEYSGFSEGGGERTSTQTCSMCSTGRKAQCLFLLIAGGGQSMRLENFSLTACGARGNSSHHDSALRRIVDSSQCEVRCV